MQYVIYYWAHCVSSMYIFKLVECDDESAEGGMRRP